MEDKTYKYTGHVVALRNWLINHDVALESMEIANQEVTIYMRNRERIKFYEHQTITIDDNGQLNILIMEDKTKVRINGMYRFCTKDHTYYRTLYAPKQIANMYCFDAIDDSNKLRVVLSKEVNYLTFEFVPNHGR